MMDSGRGGIAQQPAPNSAALRAGIDTWVFDLDDTLYPRSSGLHEQMRLRVVRFIGDLIGCDTAEAARLHAHYYQLYGTSLIGLTRHHGVKPADFLSFVHDVDITPIARSAALTTGLAALPGRRIVFTNGSVRHAQRILDHLGIADLFEAVCDIEACRFVGKPERAAYETLLARHDVEPGRAIMFDDRAVNLQVPHDLGMQTVLVGAEGAPPSPAAHIHFHAAEVCDFLAALSPSVPRLTPSTHSPLTHGAPPCAPA